MKDSDKKIQYDYEPIFNDTKYKEMHDEEERNSRVGDLDSFIAWSYASSFYEIREKYFEELYRELIDNNQYFLGCPFKIYAQTYKQRLKNYIECYSVIGSSEIDFIEYEINNHKNLKEYEHIASSRIWEDIKDSMNRRERHLQERLKNLNKGLNQTIVNNDKDYPNFFKSHIHYKFAITLIDNVDPKKSLSDCSFIYRKMISDGFIDENFPQKSIMDFFAKHNYVLDRFKTYSDCKTKPRKDLYSTSKANFQRKNNCVL